jgi:hypothetical protein
MATPVLPLILEATRQLLLTQRQLAKLTGVSLRTLQRTGGFTQPKHYAALIQALYPRNPALAAQIAAAIGKSLPELGVQPPSPPAVAALVPPPAPPPGPPSPPRATRAHAEAVICAAADALNIVPREARPIVATIFARVRDLEVDLNTLTPLLAPAAVEPAKAVKRG